ncbi:LacI family DNA-binding transcriptional regulator [Brachybacterium rhamnosum]|uniref:LacI family DNA-binding transcriptional regulator n=1 Tax=Brachybacterium rhamnosum TaxID=173361 RepID=A0ABW4Q2F8_9MICO
MPPSTPAPRRGRVTIADIARRAGVTPAAVSLAVNGRPGVSDATRERILGIAKELDWEPSPAARALAGAPVLTIGMVLARPADVLGSEAFFGAFGAGLQEVLSARDYALQMKIVDSPEAEVETYRRWFAQRRVDGVVMVDLRVDDPRVPALEALGEPALVVGGPGHHGSLPAVYVDDALAVRLVVEHLASLGHRRVARVAGTASFLHTAQRDAAFEAVGAELGVGTVLQDAGYGAEGAARATADLLATEDAPSAIVFDSDEMALAGAHVVLESGRAIPEDVAVVTIEDSPLARSHRPPITAIGRSAVEYGRLAASRLLEVVAARGDRSSGTFESRVIEPELLVRASTDPSAPKSPMDGALRSSVS